MSAESMTPSPTPTPSPLPKLDYIVSRTLIHIETAHDEPTGAGKPICSLPKSKEHIAKALVQAVNERESLLALIEELAASIRQRRDATGEAQEIAAIRAQREALAKAAALNQAEK